MKSNLSFSRTNLFTFSVNQPSMIPEFKSYLEEMMKFVRDRYKDIADYEELVKVITPSAFSEVRDAQVAMRHVVKILGEVDNFYKSDSGFKGVSDPVLKEAQKLMEKANRIVDGLKDEITPV